MIVLKYPIMVDGRRLEQITLRRPKVKDQLAAEKTSGSDSAREVALLANLGSLTPADIEELDMFDYSAVQEELRGFFSQKPEKSGRG